MNWIQLAFGLIREAAGTEKGQEVINDLRQRVKGGAVQAERHADSTIEAVRADLEDLRERADKTSELLVRTLNSQQQLLDKLERRQKKWSLALAIGVGVALILALYAALAG